jgi:hypothetical protein
MTATVPILAQAADSCLRGSVVVPFPVVGAVVGLLILGLLVYFARRA